MAEVLIGRKEEIATLKRLRASRKSEFVAVYGRRRVGKTFLVSRVFDEPFHFYHIATANVNLKIQLSNWHTAFLKANPTTLYNNPPSSWFEAFDRLGTWLETIDAPKKMIFLDELPWFDTAQSHFIAALEHFWNGWAARRDDVLLIVCGSAASWVVNKLINHRGGLHNRVTERILLEPFTLAETEAFLQAKGSTMNRKQIVELYMAIGGVPYYLEQVLVNRSVPQNIDRLFFSTSAALAGEYANLFRSLFSQSERHTAVVEVLAQKASGLTRKELVQLTNLPDGGGTTTVLEELVHSGFIRAYAPYGKTKKDELYQLIDQFALFYLNFVKDTKARGDAIWMAQFDSARYKAWSGYAFEMICWKHIDQIKRALQIGNVYSEVSPWRSKGDKVKAGAQIDLLIDRKDNVINICEIKFSAQPFTITKEYAQQLHQKLSVFKTETRTTKTIMLTFITASGLTPNQYSTDLVTDVVELDGLWM